MDKYDTELVRQEEDRCKLAKAGDLVAEAGALLRAVAEHQEAGWSSFRAGLVTDEAKALNTRRTSLEGLRALCEPMVDDAGEFVCKAEYEYRELDQHANRRYSEVGL